MNNSTEVPCRPVVPLYQVGAEKRLRGALGLFLDKSPVILELHEWLPLFQLVRSSSRLMPKLTKSASPRQTKDSE
jgi:hypothetical protein